MTLTTISIIIATAIYAAYNAISLTLFDIPESLSNTYYLWKEKNGKGYLFCLMMYAVVAFMMPAWLTLSEGSIFQFLAFLAPMSIAFVGTAPKFKDKLEGNVHSISAVIAAACSLAWVALVTPYWWSILIWLGVIAMASILTSSYKTCLVYWLEQVAFGATFTAAIIYGAA